MSTVAVWIVVILNAHGSTWSTGPEFATKEKCEVAAKVLYKAVDDARWGMNIRTPICVRIEK